MTAQLVYDHPLMGKQTVPLENYHTQANGTLVALTDDGTQLLLPATGDWIVTD